MRLKVRSRVNHTLS